MEANMVNETQLRTMKDHTPVYVFNIAVLKSRIQYLRSALPEDVRLCYAVKANTFIVKEAADYVDCLEICSHGELSVCRNLGIDHEKYVLSGVFKDPDLFQAMIAAGDTESVFTAESMHQLKMLQGYASEYGRKLRVLLRLTSGNQFGMSRDEIASVLVSLQQYDAIQIQGIQFFSGTQKTSLKKMKRELEYVDAFLEEMNEKYGFCAPELEFGPGLAVSYFDSDTYDEDAFLCRFSAMLEAMKYDGQITLEMGRAIAASCGTFITKVVDVKTNENGNFAIVDGGMHQLVYYGQFMAMKHPMISLYPSREEDEASVEWTVCGSLCTINDLLVKKMPFTDLKIGDVLVFENTGAYCMTEGIALFLTRDLPEVVLLLEDGRIQVVRERFQTDVLNCPVYEL